VFFSDCGLVQGRPGRPRHSRRSYRSCTSQKSHDHLEHIENVPSREEDAGFLHTSQRKLLVLQAVLRPRKTHSGHWHSHVSDFLLMSATCESQNVMLSGSFECAGSSEIPCSCKPSGSLERCICMPAGCFEQISPSVGVVTR
jgi:hypothetical protein